jgi:misacylated tRNA(Ala) deacylase
MPRKAIRIRPICIGRIRGSSSHLSSLLLTSLLLNPRQTRITIRRTMAQLVSCQRDSYQRHLRTSLLRVFQNGKEEVGEGGEPIKEVARSGQQGGYLLQLHDTILFPEGGGQPSDHGKINGVSVLDVYRNEKGQVLHHIAELPADLNTIEIELDWTRRFDHMQQHTAQHLISALATKHFSADTVSWQLGREQCTIDFNVSRFEGETLQQLEDLANEAIREGKAVIYHEIRGEAEKAALPESVRSRGLPTDLESIRLVEISGVDMNTCCGTHVKNLSELQMIKFIGTETKKGQVRLSFLAGNRVSSAVSTWVDREKKMNVILQATPTDHVKAATRIAGDLKNQSQQNKRLLKELSVFIGQSLARSGDRLLQVHRDEADMGFLQNVCKTVQEEGRGDAPMFLSCGENSTGGQFLLVGPKEWVEAVGKDVAAMLDGKGGGRGTSFQGKAASFRRRREVIEFLLSKLN